MKTLLVILIIVAIVEYVGLFDGKPIIYLWYLLFPSFKKEKEVREEEERREREHRNKVQEELQTLCELKARVLEGFSVELETIKEPTTQAEIVRIVNLLAHQTSVACVNQDKAAHGTEVGRWRDPQEGDLYEQKYGDGVSWSQAAATLKIRWSKTRNFALEICPELKERMPHFSEFEPLKSYREEHINEKAARRRASQPSEG